MDVAPEKSLLWGRARYEVKQHLAEQIEEAQEREREELAADKVDLAACTVLPHPLLTPQPPLPPLSLYSTLRVEARLFAPALLVCTCIASRNIQNNEAIAMSRRAQAEEAKRVEALRIDRERYIQRMRAKEFKQYASPDDRSTEPRMSNRRGFV